MDIRDIVDIRRDLDGIEADLKLYLHETITYGGFGFKKEHLMKALEEVQKAITELLQT